MARLRAKDVETYRLNVFTRRIAAVPASKTLSMYMYRMSKQMLIGSVESFAR